MQRIVVEGANSTLSDLDFGTSAEEAIPRTALETLGPKAQK